MNSRQGEGLDEPLPSGIRLMMEPLEFSGTLEIEHAPERERITCR
ncbi:hypothetical protein ABES58_27365 [Paenibacillus lautus]